MIILVLFSFFLSLTFSILTSPVYKLPFTVEVTDKPSTNFMSGMMNVSYSKQTQKYAETPFTFDLYPQSSFFGYKEESKWGISCSTDGLSGCKVTDTTKSSQSYKGI